MHVTALAVRIAITGNSLVHIHILRTLRRRPETHVEAPLFLGDNTFRLRSVSKDPIINRLHIRSYLRPCELVLD